MLTLSAIMHTFETDEHNEENSSGSTGLDNGRAVESRSVSRLVGSEKARSGIARAVEAGDQGGSTGAVLSAEDREELKPGEIIF